MRHYWRSWLAGTAALVRLLAVIGIYFLLGWILALQNAAPFLSVNPFIAERRPGKGRNDSVILLKADCAVTINGLCNWASQSGWLQPENLGSPENSISGFGQILALVIMVAVLIAALDHVSLNGRHPVKQKVNRKIKQKKDRRPLQSV